MTRKEKIVVDEAIRMCMGVYTKEHPGGLSPEEQQVFVQSALAIMDADMLKHNPKLHAAMLDSRTKGF